MTGHNLAIKGVQENAEFPMANGMTRRETLLLTTLGGGAERHDVAVILPADMAGELKSSACAKGKVAVTQQLHDTNVRDQAGRPVYRMARPRCFKPAQD